jgi:hypothetical protein
MPRKDKEAGSAVNRQVAFDKEMFKKGIKVTRMSNHIEKTETHDTGVTSIRFKAPTDERAEWFGVVSYVHEGEPLVAFHSGETFEEVLLGVCSRFVNGSLKWKEDQYVK